MECKGARHQIVPVLSRSKVVVDMHRDGAKTLQQHPCGMTVKNQVLSRPAASTANKKRNHSEVAIPVANGVAIASENMTMEAMPGS